MLRFGALLTTLILAGAAGLLLSLNSCGSRGLDRLPIRASQIQHVVVIFQENRTPDNLFHDPVLISRGADIASSGTNSSGHQVQLLQNDLVTPYDLGHSHAEFVRMFDGGRMDGADQVTIQCLPGVTNCAPPNPQFTYVNPSEAQPYFQLAEQYTFGDRMFQTNQGPSFPAHQFIISGTSAPTAISTLFAAENPTNFGMTGCIAAVGNFVRLIDPNGSESLTAYPCFEHATLTDLLDAAGISWRYYAPSAGLMWTAPNAIRHICQPEIQAAQITCTGTSWANVVIPANQVLSDIANHQLATVSWVIPAGTFSDHAQVTTSAGPSWVGSIVNSIGDSDYWNSTAIFITWDDWGGWYDHVAPRVVNSYEYGFRVPLIVVSPFAKPGYISHVTHDFGSILKFIERLYGLPSLGYADAPADDLSDCFNFSQTPIKFQTIPTALNGQFFIHDHTPPADPDDD